MKVGVASGDWIHPDRVEDGKEKWGGSGWARLAQYLPLLTDIQFITGTLIFDPKHGSFQIRSGDEAVHDIDMVWMQRLMHAGASTNMKIARSAGQIIINDLDDWYWGLSASNNAFLNTHPKHSPDININHYRAILAQSDLVTVSTPYLADRIKSWVTRCPITVVPNYVDINRFPRYEHTETDVPLVGWAGSTAHRSNDLETVAGVIKPMVNAGSIRFHHTGAHPAMKSVASLVGLRDDQVSTLPLSDHETYPSNIKFDVGVVPLNNIPFNRAKSDIKGLEYSACGIPFVAQNLDAYINLRNSLGIGRVAKRPTDWIRHLNALRSPSARREEGEACYEAVQHRDIRHGVQTYQQIFDHFRRPQ